jgi:hypothetical protein
MRGAIVRFHLLDLSTNSYKFWLRLGGSCCFSDFHPDLCSDHGWDESRLELGSSHQASEDRFWKNSKSLNQEQQILSWLGYEDIRAKNLKPEIEQTLLMIEKPKRRGRPPTHSLDRWTRVVLAWENRDPYRNPITLTEFLSQEFGTYADGTPCMSDNSFYENRKKVFDELRKNATLNQEPTS